jgi:hypothetical protein
MNISKSFPGMVTLEYQDKEWAQTIDYEHIPLRCRKFHEHGHLFRDCPLNAPRPRWKLKRNQRKDLPRFKIEGDKRKTSPQPTKEKRTQIIIHLNPLTSSQRHKRWKTPTRLRGKIPTSTRKISRHKSIKPQHTKKIHRLTQSQGKNQKERKTQSWKWMSRT